MNIKEYALLKEELHSIRKHLAYFQNKNKYYQPIEKINDIEYHLREFEREPNYIKRKIHLKKSKELIHDLKYDIFIIYRLKYKIKSYIYKN